VAVHDRNQHDSYRFCHSSHCSQKPLRLGMRGKAWREV
jgi:hypothetical protein